MNPLIDIALVNTALQIEACLEQVSGPGVGGIDLFVGTVRDQTKGRAVRHLIFEAYAPMAVSEMTKIAKAALDRYEASKVAIHHRTGQLEIGEIAVIIAVAAPHRAAAFAACRYCIDTLKETVPIWKKEVFTDGEVWVAAHP